MTIKIIVKKKIKKKIKLIYKDIAKTYFLFRKVRKKKILILIVRHRLVMNINIQNKISIKITFTIYKHSNEKIKIFYINKTSNVYQRELKVKRSNLLLNYLN